MRQKWIVWSLFVRLLFGFIVSFLHSTSFYMYTHVMFSSLYLQLSHFSFNRHSYFPFCLIASFYFQLKMIGNKLILKLTLFFSYHFIPSGFVPAKKKERIIETEINNTTRNRRSPNSNKKNTTKYVWKMEFNAVGGLSPYSVVLSLTVIHVW